MHVNNLLYNQQNNQRKNTIKALSDQESEPDQEKRHFDGIF
jgi:hypothetical protein